MNGTVIRLADVAPEKDVERNYRLASKEFAASAAALVVDSQEAIAAAADARAAAKSMIRDAKEFFAPSLRKLDEAKKALRDAMNEIVEPLETAVRVIDAKILAATKRLEEEAAKAIAAADDADGFGITAAPSTKRGPVAAGLSRRTYFRAEVDDFGRFVAWCVKTENLHLLEPNATALGDLARSTKGSLRIDGVRIVKEEGLAGGGR